MGVACLQSKMGTEVEHASTDIQSAVTTPPSTTPLKMSVFAKRSGFVIPKNKLSGSLVPVHKGTKKVDADLMNKETNQAKRKTKWGPDLTVDPTVRKGRALAYQTRINQISQQLTLGVLELEDDEESFATLDSCSEKTSVHHLSHEESELLDLERREIIGELLKLNPTYKAPADYKPLLKEAKVSIPIKEYPGYNFVGLVFGPSSDTQKRLEKETGAKIQVYATKKDTGGKIEITPDEKEIDNSYEDMYVQVSADTFEKVDSAVALVELLVTSVSVNPVSSSIASTSAPSDNVNTHPSQNTPGSIVVPTSSNQGIAQSFAGSLLLSQGQFPQYPQSWFSSGPTQTPTNSQPGLVSPANVSAPLHGNSIQVSSSPFIPSSMLFEQQRVLAASFSPVLQNPSGTPSGNQPPCMQQAPPVVQTVGPRNTSFPILQSPTTQPSLTGPPYSTRPPMSISPQFTPIPESSEKLPTNIVPMAPYSHNTVASQNILSGGPPGNIPNHMISALSGPSQATGTVANQQSRGSFSLLPSGISESVSSTIQPSIHPGQPSVLHGAMCGPSTNAALGPPYMPFPMQSSAPLPQPGIPNSFSGNAPNFDFARPISAASSRPQQPSSSDFTFQPHRPPNAASQLWQGNPGVRHPVQAAGHSSLPPQSPVMQPMVVQGVGFPPQASQPRAQIPPNFAGNPAGPIGPTRHHPMMPASHMQPRSFIPPHPMNNSLSPFPPRAGSQMHIPENHLPGPQRFPTTHQHFGNQPGRPFFSSSGAQQTYDPFSPTSPSNRR